MTMSIVHGPSIIVPGYLNSTLCHRFRFRCQAAEVLSLWATPTPTDTDTEVTSDVERD
jgi:hypothetical protein